MAAPGTMFLLVNPPFDRAVLLYVGAKRLGGHHVQFFRIIAAEREMFVNPVPPGGRSPHYLRRGTARRDSHIYGFSPKGAPVVQIENLPEYVHFEWKDQLFDRILSGQFTEAELAEMQKEKLE